MQSNKSTKNEAVVKANQWLVKTFALVCDALGIVDTDITERTHLTVGDPKLWRDLSNVWPFNPARLFGLYPAQFSRVWAVKLGFTNVDGSMITMNPSTPFASEKDVRYAVIAMVHIVAKLRSVIHKQLDNESGKARLGSGLDKETCDWLANYGFSYVSGHLSTSYDGSKADKIVNEIAGRVGMPYSGEVLYALDFKAKVAEDGALPKTIKFACDTCNESLRLSLKQVRLMANASVEHQHKRMSAWVNVESGIVVYNEPNNDELWRKTEVVVDDMDKVTVAIPCCYTDVEFGTLCSGTFMPEFGTADGNDIRDQLGRDVRTFRKVQATKRSNSFKPQPEKNGVSTPVDNMATVTTTTKLSADELPINGDRERMH